MNFHTKTHLAGIFIMLAISTAFYYTAKNEINDHRNLIETISKNNMKKYVITARSREDRNPRNYYYASNRGKSVFSDIIAEARIYNTVAECMAVVNELIIQHPNFVINYDEIIINIIY